MIVAGLSLLIVGWLILFLQVVHMLPVSLALSFLAHGMSFVGMIVGLVGVVQYASFRPKRY